MAHKEQTRLQGPLFHNNVCLCRSATWLELNFRSFMHRKFNFNIVLYLVSFPFVFVFVFVCFCHLFAFVGAVRAHKCIVSWCCKPMAIKQTFSFRSFSCFAMPPHRENHLKFYDGVLLCVPMRHNVPLLLLLSLLSFLLSSWLPHQLSDSTGETLYIAMHVLY